MTKQEAKNEKRLNNAVVESSMTLKAQLNALNTDAGYKLKLKDKDGNVSEAAVSKREQLAKYGLLPHCDKKGRPLGYTPATVAAAIQAEQLKTVGTDGSVKMYHIYRERVVRVTIEDEEQGTKDVPVYTSEEADKKVKGEAGKACKLYELHDIILWVPRIIMTLLEQNKSIDEHVKRAEASVKKYEEQKAEGLYIVRNINGKLVKQAVRIEDAHA